MSAPDFDYVEYLDGVRAWAYVVPLSELLRRCLATLERSGAPKLPREWVYALSDFASELETAEPWQRQDMESSVLSDGPVHAALLRLAEREAGAAARAALVGRRRFATPLADDYAVLIARAAAAGDHIPPEHVQAVAEIMCARIDEVPRLDGAFWKWSKNFAAYQADIEALRLRYYVDELDRRYGEGAGDNWDPEFGLPPGVRPPDEAALKERWILAEMKRHVPRTAAPTNQQLKARALKPLTLDTIKQYVDKRWASAHAKRFPSTKRP